MAAEPQRSKARPPSRRGPPAWSLGLLATIVVGLGFRVALADSTHESAPVPELPDALAKIGLSAEGDAVPLSWAASSCTQAFEIHVRETHAEPEVARYLGREPERSTSLLALGPGEGSGHATTLPLRWTWAGRDERGERVVGREGAMSPQTLGPGAPDAACRAWGWDRLDDAIALGWPRLPGRATRVGDTWTGSRIQGRCNHTACVTDAGKTSPDEPCTVGPWKAELVATASDANGWHATIVETWTDVDGEGANVTSRRESLVSAGRLVWSHTRIEDDFHAAAREVEIRALDDCGALPKAWIDATRTERARQAHRDRPTEGASAFTR